MALLKGIHTLKQGIGFITLCLLLGLNISANAQTHEAGDILKDEYGVEMVYVPGGTFTMGIDEESLRALCQNQWNEPNVDSCVEGVIENTGTTHPETIEIRPYWIDRFEVSIEQFRLFCGINMSTNIDCIGTPQLYEEYALSLKQPQGGASWYIANRICDIRGGRLPTEGEWEYAARGENEFIYAWGNEYDSSYTRHPDPQYIYTYPVGEIPENKSWVGAFDMTGNVHEWVEDHYGTRILANTDPNDWSSLPFQYVLTSRVIKGGFWNNSIRELTTFYRYQLSASAESANVGFRCVRSLMQE